MHCSICDKILVQPMQCRDEHMFCKTCITAHITTTAVCPADGAEISISDLHRCNFAEKVLSRLSIRCENNSINGTTHLVGAIRKRLRHPVGCPWIGKVRDLAEHASSCAFRTVVCKACGRTDIPLIGLSAHMKSCIDRTIACELCGEAILARHLEDHLRRCPDASMYCPNHCLLSPGNSTDVHMLRRRDLKAHLKECPNEIIACEFHELGCSFRGYRKAMPRHMKNAMQAHLSCLRSGLLRVSAILDVRRTVMPQQAGPTTAQILSDDDHEDSDMVTRTPSEHVETGWESDVRPLCSVSTGPLQVPEHSTGYSQDQ